METIRHRRSQRAAGVVDAVDIARRDVIYERNLRPTRHVDRRAVFAREVGRVVDTGDDQRHRRGVGPAMAIVDGVGESVSRRLACLERLQRDGMRRVVADGRSRHSHQRAVGAGRTHRNDRWVITGISVGVIGQQGGGRNRQRRILADISIARPAAPLLDIAAMPVRRCRYVVPASAALEVETFRGVIFPTAGLAEVPVLVNEVGACLRSSHPLPCRHLRCIRAVATKPAPHSIRQGVNKILFSLTGNGREIRAVRLRVVVGLGPTHIGSDQPIKMTVRGIEAPAAAGRRR